MKIRLTKDEPVKGHRPSVNVLMKSIARAGFPNIIGVIMTGTNMAGWCDEHKGHNKVVICQDEMSSVVYGCPPW